MTYRARLEGTSETDSGSLISLIEQWVRGGASVIVTGVLMTVDSDCSVAISSLSEPECSPPTNPPSTDPTESPTYFTSASSTVATPVAMVTASEAQNVSDNTSAIIGGVVAIVASLGLIAAATIVAIAALVLRSRRLSLKTTSTAAQDPAIPTSPNMSYELVGKGGPKRPGAPPIPPSSEAAPVEETMYEMIPGEEK